MRRLFTFVVVALATAGGTLWWLNDGDLAQTVEPVIAHWDAELLAQDAGLGGSDEVRDAPPAPVE